MRTLEEARSLDQIDPLRGFRDRFEINEPELVYLKGNSLGRLPKGVAEAVHTQVNGAWGTRLVRAWNEGWVDAPTRLGDAIGCLIGANDGETVVCDSTSLNLYKLARGATLRNPSRPNIVSDATNFPSDLYMLDRAARESGGQLLIAATPEDAILLVDDKTGVASFSHVAFKSGRMSDMAGITSAIHSKGALALWDLSHSAGVADVQLRESGADLAVGCTYKYLNGGPGAPAYLWVRHELQDSMGVALPGWFGHAQPFEFDLSYKPGAGLSRFLCGTPPMLSLLAVESGVNLANEAGIPAIRSKSEQLTSFMLGCLSVPVLTPIEPIERGSHIAIEHPEAFRITRCLLNAGIVCDYREPDTMRFGFAPLYNSFEDAYRAATTLARIIESEEFLEIPETRPVVT